MSAVEVLGVKVNAVEGTFLDPFSFEITFEAHRDLPSDLEWKLIYVGSAKSPNYDQTLESVLVGPIKPGRNRFEFRSAPPDPKKIPTQELLGVTIVLLTGSYEEQEFIRIGYYVSNSVPGQEAPATTSGADVGLDDDDEDEDEEDDGALSEEDQPQIPVPEDLSKVRRRILADQPRVTRFPVEWKGSSE